jgi:predicted dehydrogenase
MSSLLKVGVVGLGNWGPNRLRVLAENEGVEVSYICDIDSGQLARFSRRYPSVTPTTRFESLLEDPKLDALVIATPVFTHFDFASLCLEAGKHTFVEKPLAHSTEQADDLIALARRRELVLRCGHTSLYSPAVKAIKRLIDDGQLGDVYFVSSSRVNLGIHQREVSVLWDLAPHDFSMLLHWLGELPTWVGAVGRDSVVKGVADVAFVDLAFASGVIANVELSWLAPSKLRRTVVVGSEKMVLYDDGAKEPVRIFDQGVVYRDPETFGEYQLSYRTGDIVSPRLDTAEPISAELDSFLEAMRTGDRDDDQLRLSRDVVCVIESAEASLRDGGVQRRIPFDPSAEPSPPSELAV